ncbi:MAG: TRAP transporter substrate-binding protein [Atribacterota bacterium]|nr:TRAP transporter substrate-binding protein [Atribacterota bacterium]
MKISKIFIISLIILLLVSMAGYCADSKVYTWKMASIWNDPAGGTKGNSKGESQQKFVDLVKEKTNGQVIIKPFYASILGTQPELFEQVSRGQLEVFYGQPMSNIDPRFGALNIPYLFNDYEEIKKIVADPNSPIIKLFEQWIKDNHGQLIAVGPAEIRGFGNSKHPIKKVSDLKDLKVRIYEDPVVSTFWSGISITQVLSWAETYSALQTKTVDGFENPITSFLGSVGELIKYYTDIDWQWGPNTNIIVNEKTWDELPANLQKLVQEAGIEAMQYQGELATKYSKEAFEALKDEGIEITLLKPEERKEWIEYARSLDEKLKKIIGESTFNDVINAVESSR